MTHSEEQYERIARYLDGEPVALEPPERAVADELRSAEADLADLFNADAPAELAGRVCRRVVRTEIRRDEAALAGLLDADAPAAALDRAWRRVVAELARPRRRVLKIRAAAGALAVAAGLLLVLSLGPLWNPQPPAPTPAPPGGAPLAAAPAPVPVEVISASVSRPADPAVDLLAAEIEELEADMLASAPPAGVDMGIDELEGALIDFLVEDLSDMDTR